MRCPQCKTTLILSVEKVSYQTLGEHVCDPNGDPPARTYFFCPEEDCVLHDSAFWDDDGSFYSKTDVGNNWYRNNSIDVVNRRTHKRIGADALDSFDYKFTQASMRDYRGWRRIRNRISTRIGNWSCDLRRMFCPDARWRDNSAWYRRFGFSFGVLVMDFWGNHWKHHARFRKPEDMQDDDCLSQWLHHPFPWIRWQVRRWLAGKIDLRKFFT